MGQRRYRPPWVLKFGPWGVWACACSGRSILHFWPRCWPASGVGNCEMPSLPCRSETQSLPESGKEVVLFVFVVPVGGPMSEKAPWRRVGPPHSLSGDSGNRAGQPPTYLSSIFFFHPPSCGRTPQPWSCQPARTTQNIIPILFFWEYCVAWNWIKGTYTILILLWQEQSVIVLAMDRTPMFHLGERNFYQTSKDGDAKTCQDLQCTCTNLQGPNHGLAIFWISLWGHRGLNENKVQNSTIFRRNSSWWQFLDEIIGISLILCRSRGACQRLPEEGLYFRRTSRPPGELISGVVVIWCGFIFLEDLVFPELVLPQGKTQMNRHLGRTRIVDAIFFFCIWRGVLFFFCAKLPNVWQMELPSFTFSIFFAMGIHFKNWPLIFFNPYIPRLLLEPEFSFGCLLLCVFVIRCLLLVLSLWTVRTLELEFFFAECKCLSSLED